MRAFCDTLSILAFAILLTACSATLDPRIPPPSGGSQFDDSLLAGKSASGMPDPIGHGTMSVFAFRVADVEVSNGDAAELVMAAFKKTLEGHGYKVVAVSVAAVPEGPVFECRVREFEFRNYTWLVPLVWNWGDISLDLQLTDPSGRALWKQSYSGESWKFAYSFTGVVNSALEQVLDKAVNDFASPAFREACCTKPAP